MADGAEVACCMMPCGIVHDNEPEGKRDGTLHTRLDGSQGSDKRWAYPDLVARKPCMMFGINLGIILLLIMVVMGAGWAELTENSDHDWTITSTEAANLVDSIELSEKKADVPGVTTVTERSNLGERNKFFQVYQAKGGDIFTPQGIRDICKAEALLIEADEFANGRAAYESRDDAYPGMCLMKTMPDGTAATPRETTGGDGFADDCTTGMPLVTDMFYPMSQTTMSPTIQSCTHATAGTTAELRWDSHLDREGGVASRGLHYTCPAGGVSRCTLLPADRVEYYAHDLICKAAADPTALQSFYLAPPEGQDALPVPQGCEPMAPLVQAVGYGMAAGVSDDLKAALTEGCFAAVDYISGSTLTVGGVDLTPLTCASGDASVLNGLPPAAVGIPAGATLNDLCPFRCDRFTGANTFAAPPAVRQTRDLVYMAWPIQGYTDRPLQGDEQQTKINSFYYDLEGALFTYYGLDQTGSAISSAMRAEAHEGETKVMWWGFALQDLEFQRISYQDLMFTMASIMFVYYYIAFYTNSIYIGGLGMMQIIFTLPLALFFYRGIFQVTFFNQLHVLAIYLVLGIGADDIFVFVDGWNQSINQYKNTADRLDVTYKRAVYAMGATSATTCVAFMATAISPIMPIASFGIYAALGVFLNYVLVITLFPCTLMIYHYKLYGCCKRLPKQVEMGMNLCAVPACHKRDEATCCCQQPFTLPPAVTAPDTTEVTSKDAEAGQSTEEAQKLAIRKADEEEILSGLDHFFKDKYAPCITKKPVAAAMSITGLVYIIFCIAMALQLEPPTEQEKWFPDDHMYQQIVDSMAEFASAAEDQYIPVKIVFGLGDMDRSEKSFWDATDRGFVKFDDTLDLSTAEAQRFFLDTCDRLTTEPCSLKGCLGDTLVFPLEADEICSATDVFSPQAQCFSTAADACTQTSSQTDQATCEAAGACKWAGDECTKRNVWKDGKCWMQQFKDWCGSSGFQGGTGSTVAPTGECTGAGFLTNLVTFREETDPLGGAYTKSVGIVDGALKYAQITVRSTLQEFQPNAVTEPVFDAFETLCESLQASAPASIGKKIMHSGGIFWTWTFTEKQLVTNVFTGFAICFPSAYIVLLIATRNLSIATIAIVAVMGIVASVLGFCHWAMGWGLGIAESIAAVIVIGFSVDYVVHLSHVYVDAGHRDPPLTTREERVTFALKSMGSTVFSGAVTTFGSGMFLVFTQLIFFVKFSVLIMVTIASSIGIAMLFFMPTLAIIGPQDDFADMSAFFKKRKAAANP